MAGENEDIEISVTDDETKSGTADDGAATGTNGAAASPESKEPAGDLDAGVAELQRKLDESETRRIAAEQERDAAFQRAGTAEATAHGSQMAIILGAIETIDANQATLEAQYEEALANGDFKKATQVNSQLVAQAAQKVELQKGKVALEQQGRQPAPRQLAANEKVELYVQNMQPRAAAWIRAHPDYVTDESKNTRLLARHWAAKEAGHAEGSDSYFSFIEAGLGLATGAAAAPASSATGTNGAAPAEPLSGAAAATQRRDVQPSPASPSRGGGGSRTIRLSPAQQEAARMSGLTNEEYAKNMVREQQAGTIGKTRVH